MSYSTRKLYARIGDLGNIYVENGEYTAEVHQEHDDGGVRFLVYRFPLEKFFLKKGTVVDEHGVETWFHEDLPSIANSAGTTVARLVKALCGSNVEARFGAYYDIGSYHGFDEFDSYPLNLSEKELEKRERGPTARHRYKAERGYHYSSREERARERERKRHTPTYAALTRRAEAGNFEAKKALVEADRLMEEGMTPDEAALEATSEAREAWRERTYGRYGR